MRSICLHIFHMARFSLVFVFIVYASSAPIPTSVPSCSLPLPLPLPLPSLYFRLCLRPCLCPRLCPRPCSYPRPACARVCTCVSKKCKPRCVLKNAPYPTSASSLLSHRVVKARHLSWLSFLSRVFHAFLCASFPYTPCRFRTPVCVLIAPSFLARVAFLDLHRRFCSYWCSLPYVDFSAIYEKWYYTVGFSSRSRTLHGVNLTARRRSSGSIVV